MHYESYIQNIVLDKYILKQNTSLARSFLDFFKTKYGTSINDFNEKLSRTGKNSVNNTDVFSHYNLQQIYKDFNEFCSENGITLPLQYHYD